MDYLRILRLPNLLIVALTQSLVYTMLMRPIYNAGNINLRLDQLEIALLIVCTLCITAGGNIINDIFDMDIDAAHPGRKSIIGKTISLNSARSYYRSIVITGFVLAIYLSVVTDNLPWLALYPIATGALWLYSKNWKCRPLAGNIAVALLCAFVVGIIWFAERESFSRLGMLDPELQAQLQRNLLYYMGFAFLATLFREIVKDIQDIPADLKQQCKTLAVVIGPQRAKRIAMATAVALTGMLLIYFGPQPNANGLLLFAPVWLSIILAILLILRARETNDFGRVSKLAKVIILLGLVLFPFLNSI